MSQAAAQRGRADPNRVGNDGTRGPSDEAPGHGQGGPAAKRVVVAYGFWIFLISDIIMFAAVFAAYAVLSGATAGGPTGRDIFDPTHVAIETACLLASSFACGMASVAMMVRSQLWTQVALAATCAFGLLFLGLELSEFAGLLAQDAGPTRSAFLSAFFMLVGLHGLHVTVGVLWLLTMMAQLFTKGWQPNVLRRLFCFSLFWHALDIIWVAVFSIVYLMGGA